MKFRRAFLCPDNSLTVSRRGRSAPQLRKWPEAEAPAKHPHWWGGSYRIGQGGFLPVQR